jgi:hypothetical protein
VLVEVPAGTNADEVIAATQRHMGRLAREAVEEAFRGLDQALFEPLLADLGQLQEHVQGWPLALEV